LLGLKDELPTSIPIIWADQHPPLPEMLLKGDIDAAWGAGDEIKLDENAAQVAPLFTDGGKAFVGAFFVQAGFVLVNHTVVILRRILEQDPWVAEAIYEAF